MPVDKPDIVEGKKTYKYSHTDEIIVVGKIWKRDIYFIEHGDSPAFKPEVGGTGCLLFFHPTQTPAPTESRMQKIKSRPKPVSSYIRKFGDAP
ncbi:hypothetical protein C8B47_03680 [filamentous cyanobacterium CCP4]|nr:hypothetical protein C8B47_03680 [filamentous cyanobacterium CCP4]